MSISSPPLQSQYGQLGRPEIFLKGVLTEDSEFVILGNTEDAWLLTFCQGYITCDAGPCEFGMELDGLAFLAQQAQTSVTFAVSPFTFYWFLPVNPEYTFRITAGPLPAGASFLELHYLIAGYHTGLFV